MAITIGQLLNYSWMSQASYLNFTGLIKNDLGENLREKLKASSINEDKIFAEEQANTFISATEGFTFQAYKPNGTNNFSGGDGFSATVFKANASGQYTIAVRGTESLFTNGFNPQDLTEDFPGVVLSGQAVNQLIAAYRYFKQLTTGPGLQVSYTASELAQLSNLYQQSPGYFATLPPFRALSLLSFQAELVGDSDDNKGLDIIPTGATINFTGHSLGGHVAALLANMVALNGTGNVGELFTYNAPGLNALSNEINNWLGITPGVPALIAT